MIQPLPSLFLSHGAPDILLSEHEAVDALRALGERLPRPRAIVIVSAHWITDPLGITTGQDLPTIHDFGGFPKDLYRQVYPAKGDDALSATVQRQLQARGFPTQMHEHRGLDHGAWVPLKLMYPAADIPVIQVSLPAGTLEDCARLGAALSPLRDRGVLVIGSGGSVHNLRALQRSGETADWAIRFEGWLRESVEGNHFERLTKPTEFCKDFPLAHPSLDHYAPLIVAWGAGARDRPGRRIHHSFTYGNLGMSCFELGVAHPSSA